MNSFLKMVIKFLLINVTFGFIFMFIWNVTLGELINLPKICFLESLAIYFIILFAVSSFKGRPIKMNYNHIKLDYIWIKCGTIIGTIFAYIGIMFTFSIFHYLIWNNVLVNLLNFPNLSYFQILILYVGLNFIFKDSREFYKLFKDGE